MERLVKKYQQKYKKARQEMDKWDALQSLLLKQFHSAMAIIERLKVLQDKKNYGMLKVFEDIARDLPAKQLQSLENIFISMQNTLSQFYDVVKFLDKISQDGYYLLKGELHKPTPEQLNMCIGTRPSLNFCMDGLKAIYEMHQSEYLLKVCIVRALSYDTRPTDMAALVTVLSEQPNVPSNEVKYIFNVIFAEDMD